MNLLDGFLMASGSVLLFCIVFGIWQAWKLSKQGALLPVDLAGPMANRYMRDTLASNAENVKNEQV